MYALTEVLESLDDALEKLELCAKNLSQETFYDESLIKRISQITTREIQIRDFFFNEYSKHETQWASEGYRSAEQAISIITHGSISSSKKSLQRINLYEEHPSIQEAVAEGEITIEHVDQLSCLCQNEEYREEFNKSIDSLLENAKVLPSNHFARVIQHWKYIVQDLYENGDKALAKYNRRKFSLWQTSGGDWILEGIIDNHTGMLINKSLESITSKIYRDSSKEQREEFEIEHANVDALAYLCQAYLSKNTSAIKTDQNDDCDNKNESSYNYTSPLTADININLEKLTTNISIKEFLQESLEGKTPLAKAHHKTYIKQCLCDSNISFPIIESNDNVNLGKKVRLAPLKMKKQLATLNNNCEVKGCGVPAKWCDAHHVKHWLDGGETKIENLVLICKRHHMQVHNDKEFEHRLSRQITLNRRKILAK